MRTTTTSLHHNTTTTDDDGVDDDGIDDDGIDADDERTLDQTSLSSVPPSPPPTESDSSPTTTTKSSCLSRKHRFGLGRRGHDRSHHKNRSKKKINAMANRAAGKGYENETFYENIKVHSFNIENIHVMRSSLSKLLEGECSVSSSSVVVTFDT